MPSYPKDPIRWSVWVAGFAGCTPSTEVRDGDFVCLKLTRPRDLSILDAVAAANRIQDKDDVVMVDLVSICVN